MWLVLIPATPTKSHYKTSTTALYVHITHETRMLNFKLSMPYVSSISKDYLLLKILVGHSCRPETNEVLANFKPCLYFSTQ